jgi:hypothetical protein
VKPWRLTVAKLTQNAALSQTPKDLGPRFVGEFDCWHLLIARRTIGHLPEKQVRGARSGSTIVSFDSTARSNLGSSSRLLNCVATSGSPPLDRAAIYPERDEPDISGDRPDVPIRGEDTPVPVAVSRAD